MLADLLQALRRGFDQLTYWCHTYLPFNRWRAATDEVIATAREEAARYGITDAAVDRRRAYQVARMVVPNRHGEHLVDLVPDSYLVYQPTSCASTQSGKKKFDPRAVRRDRFRRHPQTLAYLLSSSELCRAGLGASPPGTLLGVPFGEPTPATATVAARLREQVDRGTAVDRLAHIVTKLHAGPIDERGEQPEAA